MKPVLAWVKKNLVVVICSAIAIILLPISIFFSSSWLGKVRADAEKKAGDELRTVENNKVTYTLPAVLPGVAAVSVSAEPNAKLTDHFKAQKDRWTAEAGGVGAKAEAFNKRTPLIEGLFPAPKSVEEGQSKGLEFADIIVGGRGRPGAYQKLFEKIHAGGPPSIDVVGTLLKDAREREVEKIKAGRQDRQLTAEESTEITKRLVDLRQSEYRKRAAQISVYGGIETLLPKEDFLWEVPAQPPSPSQAFRWQWDYWVVQDILDAIEKANGAGRVGVEDSVVKRIEMIMVSDTPSRTMKGGAGGPGGAGSEGGREGGPPPPADGGNTKSLVQPNYGASVTGRWNGSGNQVYGLRYPQLTLVVSSVHLLDFFDALAHQNFMSVSSLASITAVDPWKDFEDGYYYGEEPVVRVTLTVESVWLRSWMAPLMPKQTRDVLRVAYTEPKVEGKPDAKAEGKPEGKPEGERPRGEGERGGRRERGRE